MGVSWEEETTRGKRAKGWAEHKLETLERVSIEYSWKEKKEQITGEKREKPHKERWREKEVEVVGAGAMLDSATSLWAFPSKYRPGLLGTRGGS